MNQIKSFDLGRVGLLIKKELFYQRRAPWIIVMAVFLFLLVIHLLMAAEEPGANDLPGNQVFFYVITLLILGTIFTSAAFNELNNKSAAHHYLSIPASHLEKLISKWLVTGILYAIAFNIFYFMFTLFANLLTSLIFGEAAGIFNPFEQRVELDGFRPILMTQLYLSLHTVYLAGAVYFRKFAYFKTMIAQTVITMTVIGLLAGIGSLFFMDFWGENIANTSVQSDSIVMNSLGQIMPVLGKIVLWIIFPLWMLSYSYFRLKETEV